MGKAERIHLRGRPSDAYKAKLRKPVQSDWTKLEVACITALANESNSVWIDFDYTLDLPDDFPRPKRMVRKDKLIRKRFSAKALLKWMNDNNVSSITYEQVMRVINRFNELEKALEVL